ncbi:UNVERIFIED_CONTAM: hypothetical protein RMT77_007421 [Armadillidium vulgare]
MIGYSTRLAFRRNSFKFAKGEDLLEKSVPISAFAMFTVGVSLSMFSLKQLCNAKVRPSRLL